MKRGIVIVGGGLAGQRCAETLRRKGYEGPVKIICAEPHRPYDRPPLSKEALCGGRPADSLPYRAADWYGSHAIELLLGVSATAVSVHERRVHLSDGSTVSYEKLLIATGGRPRMLPLLAGYENVSTLRSVEDSARVRDALRARPRLAVLGAGFIGQEVAATARKLGVQVTLIEAAATPLIGVLGRRLGQWFAELHRAEGVEMITGTTVERVDANGLVRGLHLSGGKVVRTDHVVVGVGVEADIQWLQDSGLKPVGGVAVDADGRTACPDVFAAGDAAATFDGLLKRHVPGSHWESAARQGTRAALAMLGLDPPRTQPTSFWTDQYGIRIQYLGRAPLADTVTIEGEPSDRSFIATYTRAGRPVAALLVDRPRALPEVRKMLEDGGMA